MTTAILFILENICFWEPMGRYPYMTRPLLLRNTQNANIEAFKQFARVGSNQTATRCTGNQALLTTALLQLVCDALLVTSRVLRK